MARPGQAGPALGEFLTALHDRWRSMSRDELVAVLGTHAERLPVRERQAFLDIFVGPGADAAPTAPGRRVGVDLMARIAAFKARVAAGEYAGDDDGGYHWDGYGWADEESAAWVPDAESLFADIGDVFVAGDLVAARTAYESLLEPFLRGGDDDWPLELWQLESTDVPEMVARYVRCVYETTPADQRVDAVLRAFLELPEERALSLAEVSATRVDALPDLDAFLPGWIVGLLTASGFPSVRDEVRLLAEAAAMHGGADALADLARRPGRHQGGIGVVWIDALTAGGCLSDARAAAEEVIDLPGVEAVQRAKAADRLAHLLGHEGDTSAAVTARRRAWTTHPTRARLLALAATCQGAGVLVQTLAAEADALELAWTSSGRTGPDRLGCELLLLAGRLDAAIAALTDASPLGWHHAVHPGPVVLPFLWAAATGTAPLAGDGHLGQLYADIDLDPAALPRPEDWSGWDGTPSRPPDHSQRPEPAEPTLTGLLADAIGRLRDDAGAREEWLVIAGAVSDARIAAIVTGKHRGAYARAAALAYAHAEALAKMGKQRQAHDHLAAVRARYPRHSAFRGEFDAAATSSTLRARAT